MTQFQNTNLSPNCLRSETKTANFKINLLGDDSARTDTMACLLDLAVNEILREGEHLKEINEIRPQRRTSCLFLVLLLLVKKIGNSNSRGRVQNELFPIGAEYSLTLHTKCPCHSTSFISWVPN
jgi:hypothetical protein